MDFKLFNESILDSKYTFFTGKGGVGKTSVASASAINLAKAKKKVLLISTDPASNLQDVFKMELSSTAKESSEYEGLFLINLDPEKAAEAYRKKAIDPYIGLLPDDAIENMTEQLSGSCTTEIAAFNEFTDILTNEESAKMYDHIIFDTAPTGHTLRMLELPSAWNSFIEESSHGASCLGQLSGLEDDREKYQHSVNILCNKALTKLVLVTRADQTPMIEAERASKELRDIGIENQILVINAILEERGMDAISKSMYDKQQAVLNNISDALKSMDTYAVYLKPTSVYLSKSLENLFNREESDEVLVSNKLEFTQELNDLVDELEANKKRIIFTMGKGGVGKTTIASAIALELTRRNHKVTLTTTDPANHLNHVIHDHQKLTIRNIDEDKVLEDYKDEVLSEARKTMKNADLDYIEEDLRSPCTQEIAVFKAFADIVESSDEEIVVVDTAPTGHTLLLLESTESYHKELKRSSNTTQNAISKLLPKLKDRSHTEVIIVTLAEATPFYEAQRLEEDLKRAGIFTDWWLVNASLVNHSNLSPFLSTKRNNEINWINTISEDKKRKVAVIDWKPNDINEERLGELLHNGNK